MKQRKENQSQKDYCEGCMFMCNVILDDDEICADRQVESKTGISDPRRECPGKIVHN